MATNSAPFPASGESPYGPKVKVYIDTGDAAVEAAAKADATSKVTAHEAKTDPHQQYARLAASNDFSTVQSVSSTAVQLYLRRTNAPTDLKVWAIYAETDGSLRFRPYNDSVGTTNGTPFDVFRDGRISRGGILEITGTGNPNGVHTAPIGSVFRNTEAGGWNGARVWRKNSGSGDTGWVVESGDTGLREDNSMLPEDVVYSSAKVLIRRVGALVTLSLDVLTLTEEVAANSNFVVVPPGFTPDPIARFDGSYNISNKLYFSGRNLRASPNIPVGDRRAYLQYTTQDPWPTTLPGTPA